MNAIAVLCACTALSVASLLGLALAVERDNRRMARERQQQEAPEHDELSDLLEELTREGYGILGAEQAGAWVVLVGEEWEQPPEWQ